MKNERPFSLAVYLRVPMRICVWGVGGWGGQAYNGSSKWNSLGKANQGVKATHLSRSERKNRDDLAPALLSGREGSRMGRD